MPHIARFYPAQLLAFTLLWLASSACDRMFSLATRYDVRKDVEALATADRLVIKVFPSDVIVKETTQPADIAAVFELLHKHETGWQSVSGAFGEYEIYLYKGQQFLGRVGLRDSTKVVHGKEMITVGDAFTHIPAGDVGALARQLGLKWPAQ